MFEANNAARFAAKNASRCSMPFRNDCGQIHHGASLTGSRSTYDGLPFTSTPVWDRT
jgi:hypothetical protein